MHVLIADDQPEVRSAIRLLLQQELDSAFVGEVDNAGKLLEWVKKNRTDLILLDWELQGKSGKHLVSQLRSINPTIQITVLSSRPQIAREALNAGADSFASKNDSPEQLLAVITNLAKK